MKKRQRLDGDNLLSAHAPVSHGIEFAVAVQPNAALTMPRWADGAQARAKRALHRPFAQHIKIKRLFHFPFLTNTFDPAPPPPPNARNSEPTVYNSLILHARFGYTTIIFEKYFDNYLIIAMINELIY